MEQSSNLVRKRIVVTGLVQGVGFRYFAVMQARRLGVVGWVRNRFDGSVEAEAQGDAAAVDTLCDRLRRGPQWAEVRNMSIQDMPVDAGDDRSFYVRGY